MSRMTRRRFIKGSAAAAGLAAAARFAGLSRTAAAAEIAAGPNAFSSSWSSAPDRVWLGAEYWANPLQDWKLKKGRIECTAAALDRNVHLLTRQLSDKNGDLKMSVRIGRAGGKKLNDGKGSAGFRLGIQGQLKEYRNSLIAPNGLDAGFTSDGGLFIGQPSAAKAGTIPLDADTIELRLTAEPSGDACKLTLSAHDPANGNALGQVTRDNVPVAELGGNIALVNNFGRPAGPGGGKGGKKGGKNKGKAAAAGGPGAGQFTFADWSLSGSKLESHDEHAFGPILFAQYTLSFGVMKMTAQMPPIGAKDSQSVKFQLQREREWFTVATDKIHHQARTATFRIADWNETHDTPYRLLYSLAGKDGKAKDHYFEGTIRRDPVDQPVITVADVSCNTHQAFPNPPSIASMAKANPDLLAFVGDQFYESSGGFGTTRDPLDKAILDYLRKWYMHGWTWRELTRDRPSLSLPDDHDVYQGNIWGEAGAPEKGTQEMGGYEMPPDWVNVVHRTQASHHPDPYDPTPVKQGISVYYGPMTYGRISFAVIADREWKSGPQGKVPPTGDRGDHVTNPNWDPKTADVPGLVLLGDRQMKFLNEWVADWKGADMKAVISQTLFTALPTHHGGQHEWLRADYDSNGWPQTPRNEALRVFRKAFACHLAGDQHIPAVVHYGIDDYQDGPVALAGPAINVGYPRWFEPKEPGKNRAPGAPENTGDFPDHFGHPMTVLAVFNGAIHPAADHVLENLKQKSSGLAMVRFDKASRKITYECWPFTADLTDSRAQMPGWPITFGVLDNYRRKPAAHLPKLKITGTENPVLHVTEEKDGQLVYALRLPSRDFQPYVFAAGKYTIRVSDPDAGKSKEVKGVEATPENSNTLEVNV